MALNVKFLKGTSEKYEQYKVQSLLNNQSFYLIDDKHLYLGLIKLSNAEDVAAVEKSLSEKITLLENTVHSDYATKQELELTVKSLQTVEEKIATLEETVSNEETGLVKTVISLQETVEKIDGIILPLQEQVEKHSLLLGDIEEGSTVKSLVDTAIAKSDAAEKSAQEAKAAITLLETQVYKKDEVDAAINNAFSWKDL
jgi:type I site-specific restriction endonuclease